MAGVVPGVDVGVEVGVSCLGLGVRALFGEGVAGGVGISLLVVGKLFRGRPCGASDILLSQLVLDGELVVIYGLHRQNMSSWGVMAPSGQ